MAIQIKSKFTGKPFLLHEIGGKKVNLLGKDVKYPMAATRHKPAHCIKIKGVTDVQLQKYHANHKHQKTCATEEVTDPKTVPFIKDP